MLENIDGEAIDGEEAIAKDTAFKNVLVNMRTYKLAELKDLCKAINIPSTGNKTVLFQRIRDSGNEFIQRIDDKPFVYKKKKGEEVDSSLPRWVILNPEPATTVKGFDMLCSAEEGFFGPFNQDNAEGAPKHQYCCSEVEKICWPEFASKDPNCPVLDKGHLSPAAMQLLPKNIRECHPKDFVDIQISPDFVKRCIINTTNARAAAEGAGFGGTIYQDFEPFDLAKVYKMIGLLFVNNLLLQPRISMWFKGHKLYGNNFIASAMRNNNMNGADIADQLWNQYPPDHWMRNQKWWWAFFIWGIGVAGINTFKMYESMYKMERKRQKNAKRQSGSRGGMPKKWTHLKFLTELVYDLVFPGQTAVHLSTIGELDDRSIDSTRSFASFASVDKVQLEEEIDQDCVTGQAAYLESKAATPMTKNAMEINKPWQKRFDGLRHASLPVTDRHCQY